MATASSKEEKEPIPLFPKTVSTEVQELDEEALSLSGHDYNPEELLEGIESLPVEGSIS